MPVSTDDPAVQRRRLRVELRALRTGANLTQSEVAKAMGCSPSKVTRIESGESGVDLTNLRALLGHYGVRDQMRIKELEDLARSARIDSWVDFKDVLSRSWREYLGFESSADRMREYESQAVPGLLQTEEYALAVCRSHHIDPDIAEMRWQAQVRRQKMHHRSEPPQMFFVLDESSLRRAVGGTDVMREQLAHLKHASDYRHVSLQVVPLSAGSYGGQGGPFALLEFPDTRDDDVCVEAQHGEIVLHVDGKRSADRERFASLQSLALSPAETVRLIDALLDIRSDAPDHVPGST
jgi:transcriptional regulator with XRE-family HTH domain